MMKSSHNNLIKSLFVMALFSGLFLFFPTNVEAATDGKFSISVPNGGTLVEGCTYSADIRVNSGTNQSNAADVIVNYNPAQIEIIDSNPSQAGVQIQPGPAYEVYPAPGNVVNTGTGQIRLAGVSLGSYFSGEEIFGTIQFRGIPGQIAGAFNVEFTGVGQTLDSNIADSATSTDVLGSVTNAALTFSPGSCVPDSTPPTVTFQNPVNNQTNVPLNQNITLSVSDALSGVNISTLEVIVNGVSYNATSPQITVTGNPSNYSITLDPTDDFYSNGPSNIVVRVKDYSGNQQQSSISFNYPPQPTASPPPPTTVPTTSPTSTSTPTESDTVIPNIEFINPISSETISGSENIIVKVSDSGTGINLNNLIIYVNDQRFSSTDSRVTITGDLNNYQITIQGPFSYSENSSSYLSVVVTDNAGNAASSNIPFNIPQPRTPGDNVACENPPESNVVTEIPGGETVQNIQDAVKNAAPDVLKPVVEDAGVLGFASLIALLPLLAQLGYVLLSFLAGGFLWPLISSLLLPSNKKLGSVIDDITRTGISLVKIVVIEKTTDSTVRQTVSDFSGKYYLHLDPGTYIFRLNHPNYIPAETEATFTESKDVDFIFQLAEKESADFGTQAQFQVFKLDPKLISIYFALFLSVVNLIYVRSLLSTILFIVFFIIAAVLTVKGKVFAKKPEDSP